MTTPNHAWTALWRLIEREYHSLPSAYDLLVHAAATPEPDIPALSDALDHMAQEAAIA